jgi:NADH-quinone oxidoreductase subunit G
MRVVPRENEAINEVWLSDRDRFSYEGLYGDDRLLAPMVKSDGEWRTVDWETALGRAVDGLDGVRREHGGKGLGGLLSAFATVEELYLAQKLLRGLDCANIDHRVGESDFSDQDRAPASPGLGMSIAELESLDAVLLVGSYPRKEHPIINHRLRKGASLAPISLCWVPRSGVSTSRLPSASPSARVPWRRRWRESPVPSPGRTARRRRSRRLPRPPAMAWWPNRCRRRTTPR